MVESLLRQGVDMNALGGDGQGAFGRAFLKGRDRVVKLLLQRGADVNSRGSWGRLPLIEASREGDSKLVELLLERGAKVNARDDNGYTALSTAAAGGHTAVTDRLLANGADTEATVWRPLVEGFLNLPPTISKPWISAAEANALMIASAKGHVEVAEILLNKGSDVNARTRAGFTPLVYASLCNRPKSVKLLLARGADPSAAHGSLGTALDIAIDRKHEEIVALLRDYKNSQ